MLINKRVKKTPNETIKEISVLNRIIEIELFGRICKFDLIYIPTIDCLIKAVEILGSPFEDLPICCLYMSPTHHRKEMQLGPSGRNDYLYDISIKLSRIIKNIFHINIINNNIHFTKKTKYKPR